VAAASSAISGSHVVALLFYSKSIVEREREGERREFTFLVKPIPKRCFEHTRAYGRMTYQPLLFGLFSEKKVNLNNTLPH
jgi:hypothetical protein